MNYETEQVKHVADAISIGTIVATIAGWLPAIAALVSIVWGCIRVFETRTVQRWLGKRPRTRRDDA